MASNCDIEKALLDVAIDTLKQVEQSEKAHCLRANSLTEELDDARQRIAELEADAERWREWPSDSNEAEYPPDGEQVLIYCGAWASKDYIIGGISKRCGTYGPSGATHWMPKPKAPAIAAQRQKEGK